MLRVIYLAPLGSTSSKKLPAAGAGHDVIAVAFQCPLDHDPPSVTRPRTCAWHLFGKFDVVSALNVLRRETQSDGASNLSCYDWDCRVTFHLTSEISLVIHTTYSSYHPFRLVTPM